RIAFVGSGNMAEAMIRGLLRGGNCSAQDISASGPRSERAAELRERFEIQAVLDNRDAVRGANIVILSVKPQILSRVLDEIEDLIPPTALVISIAAGVPIAAIESRLKANTRVIRAMPNTPALVDAGATAIARGEHATEGDLEDAKRIFDAVGITVILEEALLDAVTGLSGSGPAYMFLIIEALSDGGVKVGLSRRMSQLLAAQTVFGSAKLLMETNEHPGLLKDRVTSPGGTAITGLHTLEQGGVRTTLIDAVEAATLRSKELGKAFTKN
ncbi:MAG TPA: pyrroline-5-carboxylate reductase, partial [Thermoanaerobaculia bacterium]|nr:pyrroline-5-carboxylate reductase [Thermoanaerobaculia bacterium]